MNDDQLDAHCYALSMLLPPSESQVQPVGHGIYRHIFTGPTLNELETLIDRIKIDSNGYELFFSMSPTFIHELKRIYAKGRRYARWQKIRKRQRRSAHRKHCMGRTYHK
jgi:hypothetical protein